MAQGMHDAEFAGATDPTGHSKQLTALLFEKNPALQGVHCEAAAAENLPATQPTQLLWPLALWNCPAGQEMHRDAPAPE